MGMSRLDKPLCSPGQHRQSVLVFLQQLGNLRAPRATLGQHHPCPPSIASAVRPGKKAACGGRGTDQRTVTSLCAGFLIRMGLSKPGPASHVFLPCLDPSINCRQPISPTRFPCCDALCLTVPTQEAFSQPGADNGLIYSPRLNAI